MGKELRTDLEKLACDLACKYHEGQFRWDNVTPYVTHPLTVAEKFEDERYKATALLHDVLEDSDATVIDLMEAGIPRDVIDAVVLLTREKQEPQHSVNYFDYIVGILDNPMAIAVKIADIEHNMLTVKSAAKRKKYDIALFLLREYPKTKE